MKKLLLIPLLFFLFGCGPQLSKCALRAKIDFYSGSQDEIKRVVVGYIKGINQLHVQTEIFQHLTWYPVSRESNLEFDYVLGVYNSFEAFTANWID